MAKRIFLIITFILIFFLSFATISLANDDNTTTKLGNEVTSSMNKTERSMDDLGEKTGLDKAGQTIENGARAVGNTVKDGMDDIRNGVEDFVDGNEMINNRAVVGETGNYTAGQQLQTDVDGRNGMSQNAWIWIVMVVVALVIISAVWFYASQRD